MCCARVGEARVLLTSVPRLLATLHVKPRSRRAKIDTPRPRVPQHESSPSAARALPTWAHCCGRVVWSRLAPLTELGPLSRLAAATGRETSAPVPTSDCV